MILGDGGVKAGFIAGAADVVLRECKGVSSNLEAMVGTSASSGNVIYYLAHGDDHPGKAMWTTILADDRFMNFSGFKDLFGDQPIYDLDFMIEQIFKKENPIDQVKVRESQIEFFLPTQALGDKSPTYFTNGDAKALNKNTDQTYYESVANIDLYDLIRASSAAPLIYDGTVELNAKLHLDAAAVDPLSVDLSAIRNDKKIIILTKGKVKFSNAFRYMFIAAFYLIFIHPFRKRKLPARYYIQYGLKPFKLNKLIKKAKADEAAGRAVLIYPPHKIGGLMDNSQETLEKTYQLGEETARARFSDIEALIERSI